MTLGPHHQPSCSIWNITNVPSLVSTHLAVANSLCSSSSDASKAWLGIFTHCPKLPMASSNTGIQFQMLTRPLWSYFGPGCFVSWLTSCCSSFSRSSHTELLGTPPIDQAPKSLCSALSSAQCSFPYTLPHMASLCGLLAKLWFLAGGPFLIFFPFFAALSPSNLSSAYCHQSDLSKSWILTRPPASCYRIIFQGLSPTARGPWLLHPNWSWILTAGLFLHMLNSTLDPAITQFILPLPATCWDLASLPRFRLCILGATPLPPSPMKVLHKEFLAKRWEE